MKELHESREAIRKIDEQIASLFILRMEVVRDVARYKFEYDIPIEDRQQEARVLAERRNQIKDEELRPFFEEFLQNTMDVSKGWQHYLISEWQKMAN